MISIQELHPRAAVGPNREVSAKYNYGYRNVYELRDTLDVKASRLDFEPPLRAK